MKLSSHQSEFRWTVALFYVAKCGSNLFYLPYLPQMGMGDGGGGGGNFNEEKYQAPQIGKKNLKITTSTKVDEWGGQLPPPLDSQSHEREYLDIYTGVVGLTGPGQSTDLHMLVRTM